MNFLNINPCLVHVLKFLCVQHTFLLYRLHTSLWHFLIFILSGKDGRSSWSWWRSLKYSTSSSNICILYRYFHHALFRNSSSNFDVSFFHLHLSFGNFWDIAHPYRLFTSQYKKYDGFLSLLWFLCINCLFILIDCMKCSTVIPFSTISNISIPVNSVNSITVFFKHAWYTNPGAKRKETGSNS